MGILLLIVDAGHRESWTGQRTHKPGVTTCCVQLGFALFHIHLSSIWLYGVHTFMLRALTSDSGNTTVDTAHRASWSGWQIKNGSSDPPGCRIFILLWLFFHINLSSVWFWGYIGLWYGLSRPILGILLRRESWPGSRTRNRHVATLDREFIDVLALTSPH